MTRLARSAAAGMLLIAIAYTALSTAGGASAHAVRVATDPAENAALSTGPSRVSATFNERLQPAFAAMNVLGPDGRVWSTGEPLVQGAVVSIGVRPLGPSGNYTVNYRVTSADGHVVSGSWTFRLTVPGTGEPGPSPYSADTSNDAAPIWPFVAGAVLAVGAAAFWTTRRRS